MRFVLPVTLAALLLAPLAASAQLGGVGDTSSFSVSVLPQYPAPFSTVSLSFLSSMIDLANTTMTVSVGGKQTYQGSVKPIPVTLGKAGSVTQVAVTMTFGGIRYTQSVVLQPQDVSIVAEPLAYEPVLYPGKPVVPLEGNTRIVAVAHLVDAAGKRLDPSALSYTWTVDGAEIANSSGIGKTAVIVASPIQYRLRDVSVLVQNQTGSLVGSASLSLSPMSPTVRMYENDPLLGIRFERALESSYTISGTEATLYAAPFSLATGVGNPLFTWFLNGAKAQTGSFITLRPAGSGKGAATLSFTASAGSDSLVEASAQLSLIFGAKTSSNFFGL